MIAPRILPFGESAVLVELDRVASIASARRARAFARRVVGLREGGAALGVPVAAAASVLVPFDPLALDTDHAAAVLAPLLDAALASDPSGEGRAAEHEIRVRYGGADGPDLEAVAAETGLGVDEVVRQHAATVYEVLFLGFAPGFAYLGEVAPGLVVPRLATPRTRVPAGSVAIAGAMTAVYPHASAGGWRLLGRTDAALFDPAADPPARLRPGDLVHFVPARGAR